MMANYAVVVKDWRDVFIERRSLAGSIALSVKTTAWSERDCQNEKISLHVKLGPAVLAPRLRLDPTILSQLTKTVLQLT